MLAAVALAASVAACAAARPLSMAERFIVPGTPSVDLSAPAATASPPASAPPAAARMASAATADASAATLPVMAAQTLEATSPRLRARLVALAVSPTPEAHLDLAAAYADYGVHDRAYDYLAAGLILHPRHAGLHEAVGRLWRDWGLPERALRHAHLAVRYAPRSPRALTTLGSILWELASREEATRAFARAFALDPTATYTRRNWCTAVHELGRPRPFACDDPYEARSVPREPPR